MEKKPEDFNQEIKREIKNEPEINNEDFSNQPKEEKPKSSIDFYREPTIENNNNSINEENRGLLSLPPDLENLLQEVNNRLASPMLPIFANANLVPQGTHPNVDKNETFISTLKREFSSTNLDNQGQNLSAYQNNDLSSYTNLPKLQNIVATANLRCILDLREIALKAKNAEYNPKRFAAVIMRIREPKVTALIFTSGKMVCTGAKSEDDCKKGSRQFAKIIQKLGFPVKFSEFKIQNIVASCDVRFPIRLEEIATKYLKFSNYEPEMFPGLIFHMVEPKIVLLIFVSGKIVLTGAKTREEIYKAYENIYPVLAQFKKKDI